MSGLPFEEKELLPRTGEVVRVSPERADRPAYIQIIADSQRDTVGEQQFVTPVHHCEFIVRGKLVSADEFFRAVHVGNWIKYTPFKGHDTKEHPAHTQVNISAAWLELLPIEEDD